MNENFKIEKETVSITINPKIYSLEVVYSAAYVFLDKAYVILDGDPKKEIVVKLSLKNHNTEENLKKLAGEFFNELINYGDYSNRAKETKNLREALLQRALITNDPSILNIDSEKEDEEFEKLLKELEEDDDDEFLDDPEGIAIPWEEKYGKKAKKTAKAKSTTKTKVVKTKKNAKKTNSKTKR